MVCEAVTGELLGFSGAPATPVGLGISLHGLTALTPTCALLLSGLGKEQEDLSSMHLNMKHEMIGAYTAVWWYASSNAAEQCSLCMCVPGIVGN